GDDGGGWSILLSVPRPSASTARGLRRTPGCVVSRVAAAGGLDRLRLSDGTHDRRLRDADRLVRRPLLRLRPGRLVPRRLGRGGGIEYHRLPRSGLLGTVYPQQSAKRRDGGRSDQWLPLRRALHRDAGPTGFRSMTGGLS